MGSALRVRDTGCRAPPRGVRESFQISVVPTVPPSSDMWEAFPGAPGSAYSLGALLRKTLLKLSD